MPVLQMLSELRIGPFVIACITVDIGSPFRGDRTQFDSYWVLSGLEVREAMRVATDTTKLRSSTSKISALEAEPEVFFKVAGGTARKVYHNKEQTRKSQLRNVMLEHSNVL